MEPTLRANRDKVGIELLGKEYEPMEGDVLAVEIEGKCKLRRYRREEEGMWVLRGDACRREERVSKDKVLGLLTEVERENGRMVRCESEKWKKESRRWMRRRDRINRMRDLMEGRKGRYWAVGYFVVLLASMWLPIGNVAIMDNLIFGLRPDHLFHASIYCFCAWFVYCVNREWWKGGWKWTLLWVICVAVGMITEFGQRLLPYRSFDINDLVANALGASLGWLIVVVSVGIVRKKDRR